MLAAAQATRPLAPRPDRCLGVASSSCSGPHRLPTLRSTRAVAPGSTEALQQHHHAQQQHHQQQHHVSVDPSPQRGAARAAAGGPPLPALALAVAAAAAVAVAAFKRLRGGPGGYGEDPFEREVLRNVNMVAVDQLSDEAIAAARARRSRESAFLKMDLEEVELPENHPWAVRRPMTQEQEADIAARLQPRRGPARRQTEGRDAAAEQAGAQRRRRLE